MPKINMKTDIKDLNKKQKSVLALSIISLLLVVGIIIFIIINVQDKKETTITAENNEEWKNTGLIEIPKEELEDISIDYHEYCVSKTEEYKNCLWTKVEDGKIVVEEKGHNYVYIKSVDKMGKEGETKLYNIYIDTDKPIIEKVEQLEEDKLTVRVKAYDNTSSIDKYLFSLDGKEYNQGTMTYVLKDLDKTKAYVLYVTVIDKAGNSTTTAVKIGNQDIDIEVPNLEITEPIVDEPVVEQQSEITEQ